MLWGNKGLWGTAEAHAGWDLMQNSDLHHFPTPKMHLCHLELGTWAPGPWTLDRDSERKPSERLRANSDIELNPVANN